LHILWIVHTNWVKLTRTICHFFCLYYSNMWFIWKFV